MSIRNNMIEDLDIFFLHPILSMNERGFDLIKLLDIKRLNSFFNLNHLKFNSFPCLLDHSSNCIVIGIRLSKLLKKIT